MCVCVNTFKKTHCFSFFVFIFLFNQRLKLFLASHSQVSIDAGFVHPRLGELPSVTVTFFFWGGWEGKGAKCPGTCWRRRKWRQNSLSCCTEGSGPQKIQQDPPGGITPGHGQGCISCPTLRKDSFCCWNITGSFRKPYLLKSWDV